MKLFAENSEDGLFGFADEAPPPVAAPAEESPEQPSALGELQALKVLSRAHAAGKLPHAILFYGDDFSAVEAAAMELAKKILNTRAPQKHADLFCLRPSGKARFIRVDPMRNFIKGLYLSPSQGARKVGVVYDADRMMDPAANAFLKTLEEPPADTTLFLLTTRPHDFLPTIHSRCFHFRIPAGKSQADAPEWAQWKKQLRDWLALLDRIGSGAQRANPAETVMAAYGLSGRIAHLIEEISESAWEQAKALCPESMEEEEREALEEGLRKGTRSKLLLEVEQTMRDFALQGDNTAARARKLSSSVADLELARGLLEINFGEAAAFEHFLLKALRHWTRPKAE